MATINGTANNDNPLNGTNSGDIINGLAGNDKIFGKDGDDTITGGKGNDEIDGGKNYDIAVYSGSFFDYQITRSGSKFTIKDNVANRDGTDTVTNVEELKFSDGIHIYLDGRNNAPLAKDDSGSTNEDAAITLNVLGNDVDFDGDALKITHINGTAIAVNGSVNLAGGGKVTLKSDGKLYFSPDGDFNALNNGQSANVSFSYTVKDSKGASDTATVQVTVKGVSPVNHGPIANNDSASLNENATISKTAANGLLSNDTDADHDTLTVTKVGSSATPGSVSGTYGVLTWAANGSYTYVANKPAADALAQGQTAYDSFTYTISDGHGGTCTATLKFTISGINDAPTANDDTGTVNEDATLTKSASSGVLINDTDPDAGATKTVSKVNGSSSGVNNNVNGTYGTLKLKADGSYTYVADKAAADALGVGQSAFDTFTYEMKDDKGATDTATLKITVVGVNDAPDAKDDAGNVNKSQATNGNVLGNDTDPDTGDVLSVSQVNGNPAKVGQPITTSYGTLTLQANGSYTYVANGAASLALGPSASAYDSFTYKISDGHGGTDTATLKIKISGTATNHAPTAMADNNSGDPVVEQGAATAGDASATGNVLANDTDPDAGDSKTVVGAQAGNVGGPISGDVGAVLTGTYGTVTIASNGAWTYALNNADTDTNALPQGASVADVFTYTMQDGSGAKSTTTLTINITGSNDGPTAVADTNAGDPVIEQGAATAGDASATGNVLGNDTDPDTGDSKTVVGVDNGTLAGPLSGDVGTAVEGLYGSVTILANGTWTYTLNDSDPETQALAQGASVNDVFTYTMQDGSGVKSTTTLTITVTGSNDGPTAVADTNDVDAVVESGVNPGDTAFPGDDTATGNVLTNDTDPDTGDTLTVVGVDNGALAGPLSGDVGTAVEGLYGSVTILADGTWTYTLNNSDPDTEALAQDDSVTDVFTYTMQDGSGAKSTTTLTITITGTNDAPVIDGSTGVSGEVFEPGDLVGVDEAGLGGPLTVSLVTPAIQLNLDALIADPSTLEANLGDIATQLGGNMAQAIAVVWDFLDGAYTDYYIDDVNEAFVRLGVEYVEYLQSGGAALFDVTAKHTPDGGDAGDTPDRHQSMHDNLLGNLNQIGIDDRFGSNTTLHDDMIALVTATEPDLLTRPYYGGYEGDSDTAARQFDLDHDYVPTASGTLVATDVDNGSSLTWSVDTNDGTYGTFAIDSSGVWTYTLDSGSPLVDALEEGEDGVDTFTVTVMDEHGATDTQVVTITVHGTNDAPVIEASSETTGSIESGDLPGIQEAGPGGPFEPTIALNSTITDALDTLPTTPSDLASVLATVTTELGGNQAQAIAVVWDFLDDNYIYYQNQVNEAFVYLGLEYVNYLQAGGGALVNVVAKYMADGADDGSNPDRLQSLHDNLLGNLNDGAMIDKFLGSGDGGSNPSPIPGLYDTLRALIEGEGIGDRPIFGGYEGTANLALPYDAAHGLLPLGTASGDLDASDVDQSTGLVWSAADTDGTSYGTFVIDPDSGEWTYTPDSDAIAPLGAGETATDTFLATVTDEHGATDSINVTITINGTNDAPVAVDDAYETDSVSEVTGNVLDGTGSGGVADSDPDTNDTLTATLVNDVSHGALTLNADGSFTYTPDSGFAGTDTFTYQVNDGHGGTDQAVVTFDVGVAAAPGQVLVLDENGNVVADFTTIQDAVDSMTAATDVGFTILVGAGTYQEQVVVDGFTDLTIEADGVVTVEAPALLAQTATSTGGRELFGVITVKNSTNVQIDGIDVDGGGNGNAVSGSNPNYIGVIYRDASGGLTNVDITGVHDAYPGGTTVDGFPIQSGNQRGVGLQVDNATLLAFTMTGGSISDFQKNATVFNFAALDVSGVTVTGGGAQTINAQNGFQALNSTGSIHDNTITEIGYAGPSVAYSSGILIYDNTNLSVTGNTVTGTNDATLDAKVVGIYVFSNAGDISGGEISGNMISYVDSGIAVYGSVTPGGIAIHDNAVTNVDFTDPFEPTGVDHEPDAGLATVFNVEGSDVHDVIAGGTSADTLSGLGGDDVFLIAAGSDHGLGETIDGGDDIDSIAFASTTSGDTLVVQPGVVNVENIYIGSYSGGGLFDTSGTDAINVDASAVATGLSIFGNDGDNTITGTGDADIIYGHGGADTITGGGGSDTVYGGDNSTTDDSDADTFLYTTATLTAADFTYLGGGVWQVAAGGEGTDDLKGIEKVVDGAGNVFLLVDQDAAGAFGTIQAAIDAASGGEAILIAPGIYSETSEYVPGDFQGLYINTPNLTLQGYSGSDGTLITNADDAKLYGPTVISAAENQFGANHWVDVDGDGLTIQGLHLQAGTETGNKLLEIWADDVTVQNNFIDVYEGGVNYTFAVAVYLNDNGPTSDEITAYSINDNILNEGIIVANGVGEAGDPEPAANQLIVDNSFIGTFDYNTGLGRYDTIVLNGQVAGVGWLLEPTQIPTISGNDIDGNSVPFILRGSDNDVANLPTATQIQFILDNNGDNDLHYAYVVDSSDDLVTATRDDGFGEYHSFAVTNTIDTLNLALDNTPDAVFGGQRDYIHAGDTIKVQSGDTGTVDSEIMVENLSVWASEHSADLNLTLATDFADGTPIAGGGVHNITLLDYAPGQGANVDVTGNALGNAIVGNSGENELRGMGGNDILLGGDDSDTFVFGLTEATDGIVDFDVIADFQDNVDFIHVLSGVTHTEIDFAGGSLITLSGDGDKIFVAGIAASDLDFIV